VDIVVYWSNTIVNTTSGYIVLGDSQLTIKCAIYYVSFHAVDSHGKDVSNAQITVITAPLGLVIDTQTTNGGGLATSRVATGTYRIDVTWKTVQVCNISGVKVTADMPYTLNLWIYYITFHVVDSRDIVVSNAQISAKVSATSIDVDSKLTDGDGNATFRLPKGDADFTVHWSNTLVNITTSYSVSQDANLKIRAAVYYTTFKTIDSHNRPVADAHISMVNLSGGVMDTGITDSKGGAESRLPEGTYTLKVHWYNVLVYEAENFTVDSDSVHTAKCGIYYLTVKTVDSGNAPIENVFVTSSTVSGITMGANFTDEAGKTIFRLPQGTYTIESYYKSTYMMTSIDEKQTATVDLTGGDKETVTIFSHVPIPIYSTNAFFLGLAIVFLIIFALLFILMFLRMRKRKVEPIDASKAGPPTLTTQSQPTAEPVSIPPPEPVTVSKEQKIEGESTMKEDPPKEDVIAGASLPVQPFAQQPLPPPPEDEQMPKAETKDESEQTPNTPL
jgi:hypothetical protein